jgi:hypothetical protein
MFKKRIALSGFGDRKEKYFPFSLQIVDLINVVLNTLRIVMQLFFLCLWKSDLRKETFALKGQPWRSTC